MIQRGQISPFDSGVDEGVKLLRALGGYWRSRRCKLWVVNSKAAVAGIGWLMVKPSLQALGG